MAVDRSKLKKAAKEVDVTVQKLVVGMKVLAPVIRNVLPKTLAVRSDLHTRCDSNWCALQVFRDLLEKLFRVLHV